MEDRHKREGCTGEWISQGAHRECADCGASYDSPPLPQTVHSREIQQDIADQVDRYLESGQLDPDRLAYHLTETVISPLLLRIREGEVTSILID